MALKFDVREWDNKYSLKVSTEETVIRVDGSRSEFRRLLVDLYHAVGPIEEDHGS